MRLARIVLVSLVGVIATAHGQIAVIVNKDVPVRVLDSHAIVEIFDLSMREWTNGSPVVVITLKGNETVARTFYASLGTTLLEMKKQWMRVQLSGEGRAPAALNSDEDVIAKVASTPGAIGFVRRDKFDNSVKIIAVLQ